MSSSSQSPLTFREFQRESGVRSYRTAWTMLDKLRCSLGERNTFPLHRGIVEIDESIVGGGGGE